MKFAASVVVANHIVVLNLITWSSVSMKQIKKERSFLEKLACPTAFTDMVDGMVKAIESLEFDKIAAIEALGLPLGGAVAYARRKDIVILRKEGTIPDADNELYHTHTFTDHSEQEKTFRVLRKAINAGDQIVIVDEHSDSGSQIKAAARLVTDAGAKVVCVLLFSAD